MMLKAVLFDLDGTLLPMDNDVFTKAYFKALTARLAPRGYDPGALVDGIWTGTAAMVKNDGRRSNEEVFWDAFAAVMGESARGDKPVFNEFYANDFRTARTVCGFNPMAGETVRRLKEAGYAVILASNPIFPMIAQEQRLRWAGLEPRDFLHITSYENASYCKPNPEYFRQAAQQTGFACDECVMVGNDAQEDTAAAQAGMRVFLLTDCLINRAGKDISVYPTGGFKQALEYILKQ